MDRQVKKVRLSEMLPLITEKLSSGGEVSIPVTGRSMYPTLQQGKDYAVLSGLTDKPKNNDVVFYRRDNGQFVLHRIVGENENGYILCGDNQTEKEYGIRREQVIAVLVAVERDGKRLSVSSPDLIINNVFHRQIHFVRKYGSRVKRIFKKKENGKKD